MDYSSRNPLIWGVTLAFSLFAASCGEEDIAGTDCGPVIRAEPTTSSMRVGQSATIRLSVTSTGLPCEIPLTVREFTWISQAPSILQVSAATDTTATVRALATGIAVLRGTNRVVRPGHNVTDFVEALIQVTQ